MSIIKQLATYDGSAWTTDDIGANASNISLTTNVAGQTNVQSALSKIVGTSALTADRAVITGTGGVLSTSTVTNTELGYLSGVTSNIQTQINTLNNNLEQVNNNLTLHFPINETGKNTSVHILRDDIDLTETDNNIEDTAYTGYSIVDVNQNILGCFQTITYPTGENDVQIYARNYTSNGEVTRQPAIRLTTDKNNGANLSVRYFDNIYVNDTKLGNIFVMQASSTNIVKAWNKSATLTAATVEGYDFYCWVYFWTSGWVGNVYCASPTSATTTVWNSTYGLTGTDQGTVMGIAIYKKTGL